MAAKKKKAGKKKDDLKGSGLPPRKPRSRKAEVPLPPMGDEPASDVGRNTTEAVNSAVGQGMRAISDAVRGGEDVVTRQVSETAEAHAAATGATTQGGVEATASAARSVEGVLADQVSQVTSAHDEADSAIREALSAGVHAVHGPAAAGGPREAGAGNGDD